MGIGSIFMKLAKIHYINQLLIFQHANLICRNNVPGNDLPFVPCQKFQLAKAIKISVKKKNL